jgi:hypothetical protein
MTPFRSWLASRCTCRMETVHSASIDPPELIEDPWCPEHGTRDPDQELEQQRDDAAWFGDPGWDRDENDY